MPKRKFICDPYLKLYLPFYELDGSSFMSRDAYGHLCTVTGATWGIQGRTFSLNHLINCGDDLSYDITSAITLEAWVKVNAVEAWNQFIIVRDDGTNRNYGLQIDGGTGVITFFIYVSNSRSYIATPSAVSLKTFLHILGTYDGANLSLYLQGISAATDTAASGSIDNDDNPLCIGNRVALDRDFVGIIGEIRMYNRALTPAEIQNNYLATKWRYKG